ncbi:TIGR01620 family protein [Ferrimonas marina]|uniref:Putative membrane protein n=1 Tax=Ferrimonas marina TaxID=299255 RepID=A0A1M5Y839_9GAMM|nr:TIGR01620 family protein [Ferrimonas marina]SHI08245.1 putative membrane protein [Ferrimonas marina]
MNKDLKPAQSFDDLPEHSVTQLQPAQDLADEPLIDMSQPKVTASKPPSKLLRGVLLTFGLLLLVEAGHTLWSVYQQHWAWFALYATAFAGAGLVLARWGWREWRRLRQLKAAQGARDQAKRMACSAQRGEAEGFIKQISQQVPEAYQPQVVDWQQRRQPHHDDAELLLLYERTVLSRQDEAAHECIYRYAAQASLLLAASPMAVLDMALMLWRNQAMLDEVARIYGIEPGYWGRIRLVRGILANLLYAGGSELALDLGTQMLSAELTGKLSARVAQGLGAGLLTARLGYAACAQCRPLPYQARQRPSLMKVQGRLLSELTRVSADALRQARRASDLTKTP